MRTSKTEIQHLIIAWLVLSLAFAIMESSFSLTAKFLYSVVVSALTVGIGFIFHEMSHKVVAHRYGCWAEFRADFFMLVFALLLSFAGFIFAAPGAVIIGGKVNAKKNGIISLAGPLMNILLAVIFLILSFISNPVIHYIALYGLFINAWIAAFNMIPVWNFDGAKILRWSKTVYALMLAVSFILIFVRFAVIK